jgi:hypothetical protein
MIRGASKDASAKIAETHNNHRQAICADFSEIIKGGG